MYRFLITAILFFVLSLVAYLQLQQPYQEHHPFLTFQLIICTYIGIVSMVVFILAQSIKRLSRHQRAAKNYEV